MMYGGSFVPKATNALHKVYIRKFRRNAFPNRRRQHWNVSMNGVARQRPKRMMWPYDITSLIFNQASLASDKIGYVTSTNMLKTAVVSANYMVYYPKFNQRVARTGRYFAHDEDLACVEGDLVHIKLCRKISKYKQYYIFSILEPNIEGRERLKLGLPAVPPPLFGYPTARRVVKLNLVASEHTKQKLASNIQEQVQEFYRFSGNITARTTEQTAQVTFDDANKMVGGNAPRTTALSDAEPPVQLPVGEEFTELEHDSRSKKGEDYWMNLQPSDKHNVKPFTKAP